MKKLLASLIFIFLLVYCEPMGTSHRLGNEGYIPDVGYIHVYRYYYNENGDSIYITVLEDCSKKSYTTKYPKGKTTETVTVVDNRDKCNK